MEVARRQIETAIRLYFHAGDAVSIHTLAAAGRNVLVNLCAHRQVTNPLLLDQMLAAFIKPEHHKEVRDTFRAPENFFKHADRDPDGAIAFNPEWSEFFLLEAAAAYATLTGEVPAPFAAFRTWWFIQHPDLLNDTSKEIASNFKNLRYGDHQKPQFYAEALRAAAMHGLTTR
jgi:hypothetical protein